MLRIKILNKLRSQESVGDDSHYQSGLELVRQGRHHEAISEFKQALQTGDGLAETYLALGAVYDHLDRIDEAIEAYSRAVKVNPNFAEAYASLGLAYDRSAQFLKAVRMHLTAIRLRPDDVELRKNLGLAYFNVGSYPEAIKAYKQALQINPKDATTHYSLGLVYLDLRDKESALEQQKLIKELGEYKLASELMDEIDRQFLRSAPSTFQTREPGSASTGDEPSPIPL
jgi:tetratricopeptide (TPR) repeat protein